MEFSHQDLLSVKEVIADVARIVGDSDMRTYSVSYYKRKVKDAINELSIDAPFQKVYKDIPLTSMKIPIPSGCWDLQNMWVYSGDCCDVSSSREVHYKRNYQLKGSGEGYFANNKPGQADNFIYPLSDTSNIYFYNIQNGYIVFSNNCLTYDNVRVEFNGFASDIDVEEAKIIPRIVKEAIIYKSAKEILISLLLTDNAYYGVYNNVIASLDSPVNGYWAVAKKRLRRMSRKEKEDLKKYYNRIEGL